MIDKYVRDAFNVDAEAWLLGGYKYEGYNYPVALKRLRVVLGQVSLLGDNLNIVDLGCGGGDTVIALAKAGHKVDGIDQSEKMIEIAGDRLGNEAANVTEKVALHCADLDSDVLDNGSYDVVVSLGVIGYLETDSILLEKARKLLKPGGTLLVSCRNRLFNMTSISYRTVNEIESGDALELVNELNGLDTTVPEEIVDQVVKRLAVVMSDLSKESYTEDDVHLSPSWQRETNYRVLDTVERRQHTPLGLDAVAKDFGFACTGHFGVHPHLINPRLNKIMPPTLFNKLSDCLDPMESLPISLSWSSVFIAAYRLDL